jgi:putative CocE/NonD family hydrolase
MTAATPFPAYKEPANLYAGHTRLSYYIPMQDGVRLAADVYLPKGVPPGVKLPAILTQTRYWRDSELTLPFKWLLGSADNLDPELKLHKPYFLSRGFALVYIDERGTGASFGTWRQPWDEITVQDAGCVLDWIVSQEWSNGKVGGMGTSYNGTTAEMLLAVGHPAVRAVAPLFNHPDPFVDVAFPGGLFNDRFIHAWSDLNGDLDANRYPAVLGKWLRVAVRGVQPVDGPNGRALLKEAIRGHAANLCIYEDSLGMDFRDQPAPASGQTLDSQAVHRFREAMAASNAAVYGWASWQDAGTAAAALRRYQSKSRAGRAVIGAWCHGGRYQASPYTPPETSTSPGLPLMWAELARFFDAHLNGRDDGIGTEKKLVYYTLGAEIWQSTVEWPPRGFETHTWYFDRDARLSLTPPRDKSAADEYAVDFEASTGDLNRWWELGVMLKKTVVYPDRQTQTPRLLSYTSGPLERDMEITGQPVVYLHVTSSEPDCAFIVYIEDVAPDGNVTYVTEGQLRSIHRKISRARPPYPHPAPYHTFKQADALPLERGVAAEVVFGLQPVSARIQRGHRIRVSLAGHDNGAFRRTPAVGAPVWSVSRSVQAASRIDLPLKYL